MAVAVLERNVNTLEKIEEERKLRDEIELDEEYVYRLKGLLGVLE